MRRVVLIAGLFVFSGAFATPSLGRDPGDTFRDCPECPEMVVIGPGSFRMGSNDGDSDEKPSHAVDIGYSFAVGKYEVTQAEWRAVMGGNPSHFKGDRNPVEHVSWDDAQEFIRKLNAKTGKRYRLPSEAEWEYMARAGTTTTRHWGNSDEGCRYANGPDETARSEALYWTTSDCEDGYGLKTAPVGQFQPNGFGVYDVLGNVREWTQDCWHETYEGAPSDGSAWAVGGDCSRRGLRGGAWYGEPRHLRSAERSRLPADRRHPFIGFRLARTLP